MEWPKEYRIPNNPGTHWKAGGANLRTTSKANKGFDHSKSRETRGTHGKV